MTRVFLILGSAASPFSYSEDKPFVQELCPRFILIGELNPALSNVEKRLICGDPEKKARPPNEGWKVIPYPQARFNLTNFLQDRGYHHPVFTESEGQRGLPVITVNIGQPTLVTRVEVEGTAGEIPLYRKRDLVGERLTPALLGRAEKWVFEQLQNIGYACPSVKSQANVDTGEILIRTSPGEKQTVTSITQETVPGLMDNLLRRYDAFELGQLYDGRLLTLTERRVSHSGIVLHTQFSKKCEPDGVHLMQSVLPGSSRLLIFGAGINTEGVFVGKATWKNARLGYLGSQVDLTAYTSAIFQTLEATLDWYFLPHVSRTFLHPEIHLTHLNQNPYEVVTTGAQFGATTEIEHFRASSTLFLGPSLDYFRTVRGVGARWTHLLSLEVRWGLKSHLYEYYANDPRTGYAFTVTGDFNTSAIVSQVSVQRLLFNAEGLWNLTGEDPPRWVFGVRGAYATLLTDQSPSNLPPTYLQYLGGSTSLRGFGLLELPGNGQAGGLSSAFIGMELRLTHSLPFQLDPFAFLDLGGIGSQPVLIHPPLYLSPGFGVRWNSPVGPLRTTIAHGISETGPNHFQFYFSFGEEF